jgi:hypothetical protein
LLPFISKLLYTPPQKFATLVRASEGDLVFGYFIKAFHIGKICPTCGGRIYFNKKITQAVLTAVTVFIEKIY